MISVIIPTLDAGARLEPLLDALDRQNVEKEVILVDSSSRDNSARVGRTRGATVLVIPRENFDHGKTRNLAAEKAAGEVLVFLTQDALPGNDSYLAKLTAPLADPSIAASYGRQIPAPDSKPLERFARLFNYPPVSSVKGREDLERLGIKTFYFTNVCSAIRKKEFREEGGFPSKIILNEDMMLAARLILKGYRVAYVAEAEVVHSHDYSVGQQFSRYFDIGVSFATNPWIMTYAKADREGARLVREEMRFLVSGKKYDLLPLLAAEVIAKFLAFKLGLYHRALPGSLCRRLSMHKGYWKEASYSPSTR